MARFPPRLVALGCAFSAAGFAFGRIASPQPSADSAQHGAPARIAAAPPDARKGGVIGGEGGNGDLGAIDFESCEANVAAITLEAAAAQLSKSQLTALLRSVANESPAKATAILATLNLPDELKAAVSLSLSVVPEFAAVYLEGPKFDLAITREESQSLQLGILLMGHDTISKLGARLSMPSSAPKELAETLDFLRRDTITEVGSSTIHGLVRVNSKEALELSTEFSQAGSEKQAQVILLAVAQAGKQSAAVDDLLRSSRLDSRTPEFAGIVAARLQTIVQSHGEAAARSWVDELGAVDWQDQARTLLAAQLKETK